jgi:serine/threonine protein phosphatase PrpC
MTFDECCFTSIGGKTNNEDSIRYKSSSGVMSAVVADGVGSDGGGDIASSVCADMFIEKLQLCNSDDDITELVRQANAAIISHQTPKKMMKSTVVMVSVKENVCQFVHAGDSRGYVFRDGRVLFQTLDHSIPQMDVLRGNITPDEIRFHKSRNKILKALGTEDISPEISSKAELRSGDALLLCTDGFWEYVTENEMLADLSKSDSAAKWVSYMLERIGKRIDGENDNLSAIAVICG